MSESFLFEKLVAEAEEFLDKWYSPLALEEMSQNVTSIDGRISSGSMALNWTASYDFSEKQDKSRRDDAEPIFYGGIQIGMVDLREAIRLAAIRLLEKRRAKQ